MSESKLRRLPGAQLSPTVVLHQTLEMVGNIKSIAIVIQRNDDTFDIDWSSMKVSEMSAMSLLLSEIARRILMGEEIIFEGDSVE